MDTANKVSPPKTAVDPSKHAIDSVTTLSQPDKEAFSDLSHQFTPTGHSLHCVKHSNSFFAERWGHVRDFATLDDARKFLVQIGGHHG